MSESAWESLKAWLLENGVIDDSIVVPEMIYKLDLSHKKLQEVPESIAQLKNLILLNLSNNELSELPSSFVNLKTLSNLDLRRNNFSAIPDLFEEMNLKSLNISSNKIQEVRSEFNFHDLRVLDLSSNQILKIDHISCGSLRTLNLSSNYIDDVSALFESLKSVERLNLAENIISSIPDTIEDIEHLLEVDFSDNRVESISEHLFDLSLEKINLSSNNFQKLELKKFAELESIVIDYNELAELHIEADFAPYLQEFSAESCQLEEFVELPSTDLRTLSLASNELSEIPESIKRYEKLHLLDLEGNNISELPDALANMTRIDTLYINGNSLSEKAKGIIEVLHPDICDINMKHNVTIEFAKESDLYSMAGLLKILFEIEKDFKIDFNKQLAGITKLFNHESATLLVARHEGEVVGMLTMQRLISSAEGDYVGQLEDLVVKDEYRKMGIGSRLINKMRFMAIEEFGYKRIQLAADMDNHNALNFYTRRGFRKTNLNIYHHLN